MIRSSRRAFSAGQSSSPLLRRLVRNTPASGPGAQIRAAASSRPSGLPRSSAIERLPLFIPAQNRLLPSLVTGQR